MPVTIVGVISPEFVGVQQAVREGPDIAVPLALDAQLAQQFGAPPPPGEPPCRGWPRRRTGGSRSWAV